MYDTNDTTTGATADDGTTAYSDGGDNPTAANDALFTLHDAYDTGDGGSRFADSLGRNRWMFRDKHHKLTSDPTRFVVAAFQAGSPPIMNPPYVGTHHRVVRAYPRSDRDTRHLLIAELAIPTPRTILDQLPRPVRGWERDGRGGYRPPQEYDRMLAYLRLTLGIPIHADLLPEPGYDERGVPDPDIARRALRAVTTLASAVCAQLLGSLNDTTPARF